MCRDVSAASELLLELWDIGGTRGAKQLQKLSQDPSKVIANARFLGSVEVPMTATMAMSRGMPFLTQGPPPPSTVFLLLRSALTIYCEQDTVLHFTPLRHLLYCQGRDNGRALLASSWVVIISIGNHCSCHLATMAMNQPTLRL